MLATSHFSTCQRSALGDAYQLDLEGSLLVGGIGSAVDNAAIPPNLWSATLRYGYVGCMRDLIINGNAVDLAAFARQQDSGGWQQTGFFFQSDTLHAQKKTLIDWVGIFGEIEHVGAIRPACHVLPPQCESQPCMNGGVCTEGWTRFLCDCSATSFNGPTCGKGKPADPHGN